MNDDVNYVPILTKAVKTLTVVLACLCVLQAAQLGLYAWGYVSSLRTMRQASVTTEGSPRVSPHSSSLAQPTPEVPLHELSPEKMIARSSVILLVTYMPEGERFKAVVAEFLKRDPEAILYFSVGDEFPELSYTSKAGETCGEGQVVFLVGSPAEMRSSYSFSHGRIDGLGGMPLTILRELAHGKH